MAGISSASFRGICCGMGASYAPTELVSARSIVYNGLSKSFRFAKIDRSREKVTCIQLFGSEPSDFEKAIDVICSDDRLKDVDIIDINMGCPVSKVIKTGAGSALMKDPALASRIVKASVSAAGRYGKPVTVKTRTGFGAADRSGPEFAKVLADSGAAAITVHGRTASQMYGGTASIEDIAKMRDAVREYDIPFLANGDIKDGPSAKRMLDITGADGIMIGRAATGNPGIFREVRDYLDGKETKIHPSVDEKCDMLLTELKLTAEDLGEHTAVREMRKVMPHYVRGMKGAAKVKVLLCSADTIEDVRKILDSLRNGNDNGME